MLADFLRAAGLYVASDHISFVRVRKDLFRLTVIAEETRELGTDRGASSRRQVLSEAFRSLLPHFSRGKEPLYLCISPDQTICIELYLPLVAQENLGQALEYEIERQLPLRREEVYYDFLPAGRKGEKLRVFLFAVPKKVLDDLLNALSAFGVRPTGVEPVFTSLCRYFFTCATGEEPSPVIIGGDRRGWEVAELGPGKDSRNSDPGIVFIRYFSRAEWNKEVARELFHDSLGRSRRRFGWGAFPDFFRLVDINAADVVDLRSLGGRRFSGDRHLSRSLSLPAVGVALRGLREGGFPVNFLPDGRDRGKENRLSWLNAALAVFLLLAMTIWGVSHPLRDELRVRQLQRENRKLESAVEALRREEKELEHTREETALLSRLQDRRGEVLRILDELSRILPNTAYLSAFRYRDGTVELQGSAESASNLIPVLERSPLLRGVAFTAPSNRGRDDRETFALKAELEPRAEEAVKP